MSATTTVGTKQRPSDAYPCIDVSNLTPASVIAALWNARCETWRRQQPYDLVRPEDVDAAFRAHRPSLASPPSESDSMWDPAFLRAFLECELEVLSTSAQGSTTIRVWQYDKSNGWGRASQVIEHLRAGNDYDTRHLARRQSFGPVYFLALMVVAAVVIVYRHITHATF